MVLALKTDNETGIIPVSSNLSSLWSRFHSRFSRVSLMLSLQCYTGILRHERIIRLKKEKERERDAWAKMEESGEKEAHRGCNDLFCLLYGLSIYHVISTLSLWMCSAGENRTHAKTENEKLDYKSSSLKTKALVHHSLFAPGHNWHPLAEGHGTALWVVKVFCKAQ